MSPVEGVFESILVIDGVPRRADAHLDRLSRSCRALSGRAPDGIDRRLERTVAEIGPGRMAVRMAATATASGWSLDVSTRPLAAPPRLTALRRYDRSRRDWTHKWIDRDELSAAEQACVPALPYFCGPAGEVAEMSRGNIFCRPGGAEHWLTPPVDRDALPGITRAAVIEWLSDGGVEVRVEPFPPATLQRAELVFWTSSLSGAVAVGSVDDHPIRADAEPTATLNHALGTGA